MKYSEELEVQLIDRLKIILKELPDICSDFFISIAQTTSIKTRLGYAYDLRIFFDFLCENVKYFRAKNILDIEAKDLEQVSYKDIDRFLDYISYHQRENITKLGKTISISRINNEKAKARKLSAIRRMFYYFYKVGEISSNPAELVDIPKIHQKNIIYLDKEEIETLLNAVENGTKLTKSQQKYHNYTKKRDFAIICLLLGTGMRVSECVGINIDDVDFYTKGIKVLRKGGNESILYFGEEVYEALSDYLDEREGVEAIEGHEEALFLSMQRKRINIRTVQNLVKKYSKIATPLKNISPHKLRSTYGTALYEKTEDIYLVADALGHADINTTKKHYAKMHEKRRKQAALVTKLRDDKE
ncbi:tyrosine-type recombinase/integrase [[Clostridium] colinum]|uniref:tyrosine-type recombinase/integrase n=1 Tax=[Clostridium] colinum TaxID=36835 RepID=UPI00202574C4|nr:tyrosine-type recombinase/integrase [[Clostridium] colinum]